MTRRNSGAAYDSRRFLDLLRQGADRCGITSQSRLLVAFSGGADSTALLLGLRELASQGSGFEVEAAHFNHSLRGEKSEADAQSCKDLCDRLGIELTVGSGDVRSHSHEAGMSVEAAARDFRYRFLAQTVEQRGRDAVVTAHTMDDQAETVLLAITRGAGLRGASGMGYVTERRDLRGKDGPLRVLRPMLRHRREETERFCEISGIEPLEDESNRDLKFARNRVRHRVLPELAKVNPDAVGAISRMADIAASDIALIDEMTVAALGDAIVDEHGGLSKSRLAEMSEALRLHVLAAAYRGAAGTMDELDMALLESASSAVIQLDSGSIDLPNSMKLVIEHDTARFLAGDDDPASPYPPSVDEHRLTVPGKVVFGDGSVLYARYVSPGKDLLQYRRWQAVVDASAADTDGFEVRSRRDGDRFQPLGMPSEVKLQDFFVNQHVPARWRDRVPLVLSRGRICWVAGERIADWAKVPEGVEQAVVLEFVSSGQ